MKREIRFGDVYFSNIDDGDGYWVSKTKLHHVECINNTDGLVNYITRKYIQDYFTYIGNTENNAFLKLVVNFEDI